MKTCISENASGSITEDDYYDKYDSLFKEFTKLEAQREKLTQQIKNTNLEAYSVRTLISEMENHNEVLASFDPILFSKTVEKVIVDYDSITFHMYGNKQYSFDI